MRGALVAGYNPAELDDTWRAIGIIAIRKSRFLRIYLLTHIVNDYILIVMVISKSPPPRRVPGPMLEAKMARFTENNTEGFSVDQIDVLNAALDIITNDHGIADDENRVSDAISNAWYDGATVQGLVDDVLRGLRG